MRTHAYYLFATPSGWCLRDLAAKPASKPIDGDAESREDMDLKGVLQTLASVGGERRAVAHRLVIGVPANWCLCATVAAEGLPHGQGARFAQALSYRLEAELPITAEKCAFGFFGQDLHRMGIALSARYLEELVHALEDAGHVVEAIVPRALLAAQGWQTGGVVPPQDGPIGLLWRETTNTHDTATLMVQLLLVQPDQPPCWRVLEATPASLTQQILLDRVNQRPQMRWYASDDLAGALREALIELEPHPITIDPLPASDDAESSAAFALLENHQHPWVNLNQGPLAPRHKWRRLRIPAWASIAAAIVLLLVCVVVLQLRAREYNQIAERHDQLARSAFAQAMPGQTIPTSPQTRLRNRLKELRGEQGLAAGDQTLTDTTPVLILLRDTLAALPKDQRFVITDLRVEAGELRLSGHARSHSEADQIANALRQNSPFIVEPPSTDNLREGGVRFTLQARHRIQAKPSMPEEVAPSTAGPSLAKRVDQEDQP